MANRPTHFDPTFEHARLVTRRHFLRTCQGGIGAVDVDLVAVCQPVLVGVVVQRVGVPGVDLVAVCQPILVCVPVERIGLGLDLFSIPQTIVVAVGIVGMGSKQGLFGIGQPVLIRIGVGEVVRGIEGIGGIVDNLGSVADGGRCGAGWLSSAGGGADGGEA